MDIKTEETSTSILRKPKALTSDDMKNIYPIPEWAIMWSDMHGENVVDYIEHEIEKLISGYYDIEEWTDGS